MLGRRAAGISLSRVRPDQYPRSAMIRIRDSLAARHRGADHARAGQGRRCTSADRRSTTCPHVGHGRTAVVFDMIRRYLEWTGLDVTYVSNVTDVEDKIIARAAGEGRTEPEVAARVRGRRTSMQLARLGIARADHTPARDRVHRADARSRSASSVDGGHAYVVDGQGVYFEVETLRRLRRAAAPHARGAARVGRRPGRRRRGEAQPDRLRALEGGEAGRAGVGLARGDRAGRDGTSSAPPCRSTSWARASTSTRAEAPPRGLRRRRRRTRRTRAGASR